MKASAGKLNRRITIQSLQAGQDALGQPTEVWADVATVWAHIANLSGLSQIKNSEDTSIVKSSVRVRYRADLTAAMRVLYKTFVLQIDAVIPDEDDHTLLDLVCKRLS